MSSLTSSSLASVGPAVDAAKSLGLLSTAQIDGKGQTGSFMDYVSGALSIAQKSLTPTVSAAADSGAIPSELLGLLDLQRQMEIEMESVSLISNIEQAQHETKMAAVRNIRMN